MGPIWGILAAEFFLQTIAVPYNMSYFLALYRMQKGYLPASLFKAATFASSGCAANGSCIISVLCLCSLLLNEAKEGSGERMGNLARDFEFMI